MVITPVTAHRPTRCQKLFVMVVRTKDITGMHAQLPTPISKAVVAKDVEGKMAARAITKAAGAARDLAARENEREKATRVKGAKDCMSMN